MTTRSARTLLVDAHDRILLLRFRFDPRDDPSCGYGWCTPGGGVHDGEDLRVAAAREVNEEVGLVVSPEDLIGPVAWTGGTAQIAGSPPAEYRDDFFFHRVDAHEVDTSRMEELEAGYHAGHRWWTFEDLAGSAETIQPYGLVALLRDLIKGHIPVEPLRLPWHH